MKTLIQNYSTPLTTESMYFAKCLELQGAPAHLWADPNVSAFDMFDAVQPDVFITHYQQLSNDALKYLQQNKKISAVFNVTGATEEEIDMVEDFGINVPFVFTNIHSSITKIKPKKIKTVDILPAADIFLAPIPTPNYEIDLGVLGVAKGPRLEEIISKRDTYHLLSLNDNEHFDMKVDLAILNGIYKYYKEFMISANINVVFSQILFDAALHANKLTIDIEEAEKELFYQFLSVVFNPPANDEEPIDVGALVKKQVKQNHTCVSRAARLCKFLGNSDLKQKFEKMKSEIVL